MLDKTGPLLKENEYPAGRSTTSAVRESHPRNYGDVSGESSDNNITMRAMRDYFELSNRYDVTNKVAFFF